MVENYDPISAAQNSRLTRVPQRRPAASLYFPENYQNIFHYVTFTALKFESVTRTSTIRSDQPIVSNRRSQATRQLMNITLPMPDQLNTAYNAQYADAEISALGEVMATGVSNINVQQANENFRNGRYAEGAQALAQSVGGAAGLGAAAADVAGRVRAPSVTAAVGNVFGFARNPQKVVQFNGVDFRTHQFNFKLTPKNLKEAIAIQKIILAFKHHMLPKYGIGRAEELFRGPSGGGEQPPSNPTEGGATALPTDFTSQAAATSRAFLEYPDVFKIVFNNEKTLFTIGESVLRNFSIDYHPQNYPAYVRSLSSPSVAHPASITISMEFRETDIITREQVDEKFR
jgi:hypothetical protein